MLTIKIYTDTPRDLETVKASLETNLKPIVRDGLYLIVCIQSDVSDSHNKPRTLVEVHNSSDIPQAEWAINTALRSIGCQVIIVR